jgi:predicted transcriptional regulator
MIDFSSLQVKLTELTKRNISQTDIAEALGLTRSTVSARVKSNSKIKFSEQEKLERYFKLPDGALSGNIPAKINAQSIIFDGEKVIITLQKGQEAIVRYVGD